MKKQKLIVIVLLVAIFAFAIGYGTYAWFTDKATSSNNVFQTGTLDIGGTLDGTTALATLDLQNLYPGSQGSRNGVIAVKNYGTLDLKYKVSSEYASGSTELFNKLKVRITKGQGDSIYDGALSGLNGYIVNENMAPNTQEDLTFVVTMDDDADDTYQNKEVKVNIVFDATQNNNSQANWANTYTASQN